MLLRGAALREVGAFDPGYFMYYEDLDLCWRFQKAGWQNWCDSRAVTWHHIENASRSVSSERWRWQMKATSKRHFYRKHAKWYAADLLWLLTCSREMIHLLGNRYWTASWHLLRAVFRVACGFPEARPGD